MKFVEASLDHVTTDDESESEGQDPSEEYEDKASGVLAATPLGHQRVLFCFNI
jgi:hypothetical protein